MLEKGIITGPTAKAVFEEMFLTGVGASEIVSQKGLSQISDAAEIAKIAQEVISKNTQAVADYKAGKEQAIVYLVGQVMKATKGRANPSMARETLLRILEGG
jgi:aspartyl-tRNA(Asn)/glutamyl-tRNA(Gln) amidotransferase subunit B